jgi:predicted DCC family thiol-disulfide oxidoreductase YuxK
VQESNGRRIVVFDGECNLCNRSVQFIIKRDARGVFEFAPLQWAVSRRIIADKPTNSDSVLLLEDGKLFARSDAVLRIARRLRFPWPLLYAFIVVPRPIRDAINNWIARNRYRWFGRRDSCMNPDQNQKARFLQDE